MSFFSFESDDGVDTYAIACEIWRELGIEYNEEFDLDCINRIKMVLDSKELKC